MKYFDKIERRLKGQMSESEEKVFDQELRENEELAKEYELQKLEEVIIDFAVEDELLARIKQIGKEKAADPATTKKAGVVKFRKWRRGITAIAASLAVLIAAYFAIEYNNAAKTPKSIALASYRKLPPNLSGTKAVGSDPEVWETNQQLLLAREKEKLEDAVAFFESEKVRTTDAAYYLGHGYWSLKNYEKALLNFEYFLDNSANNNRLFPAAEYYKSLTLLALNRAEDARNFIIEHKAGHPFEEPWNDLLDELK